MSAGFTPVPWETRRAKTPDNTGGFDYAIVADGRIIAEAFENVGFADGARRIGSAGYDRRPVEANARLIAAAPELYEALAEYMACVALASHPASSAADVLTLAELQERMTKARDGAEAALAKARGEQP